MALRNLKGELAREGIQQAQIADYLGQSLGNVNKKINESVPFTITEAFAIKRAFFPTRTVDYLFESDGDVPSEREKKLAGLDALEEYVDESGTRDVFGEVLDEMRAELEGMPQAG